MPLFLIERNFADRLELSKDDANEMLRVEADVGITWLFSFLSTDKKKTYCVYEAPSAELIREAADRLNEPADSIIEMGAVLPGTLPLDTLKSAFPRHLTESE